eukprot:scaffold4160_cov86-Cylindrotheca_fusiformis.AAC.4
MRENYEGTNGAENTTTSRLLFGLKTPLITFPSKREQLYVLPSKGLRCNPCQDFGVSAPLIGGPSQTSSPTEELICKLKFKTVTANQSSSFTVASIRFPDDMSVATDNDCDADGSAIHGPEKDSKWDIHSIPGETIQG